jgi:ferric-dicitrate binding protein FerR (iron transport regulator)
MERDDWQLVKRYHEGRCSPAEAARVADVFATDAGRRAFLEVLRAIDPRHDAPVFHSDAEAFEEFERRIAIGSAPGVATAQRRPHHPTIPTGRLPRAFSLRRAIGPHGMRRFIASPVLGVASGIAVAAVTAIIVFVGRHGTRLDRTAVLQSYQTVAGQLLSTTLANGTRVTLAPNTTIRVTGAHVVMSGEALFVAPHRPASPLTIQTSTVSTRVLGTTFSVRRYPDDGATHVIVSDGKVSTGARRTAVLTGGERARVTDSTITVDRNAVVRPVIDWTNGRLVFDDAPVSEVLEAAGRWYGITLYTTDSTLARYRVSTIIDARRSRSGMLAALETVLEATTKTAGDTVVLVPRSQRTTPSRSRQPLKTSTTLITEVGR